MVIILSLQRVLRCISNSLVAFDVQACNGLRPATALITKHEAAITEEELDAQLMQLRAELAALERERIRAESARARTEAAREQLRDAEKFLNELSRRVRDLKPEEMAAIVRRVVPRVVVKPRADGRRVVAATYRFSQPAILGTDPFRQDSSNLEIVREYII